MQGKYNIEDASNKYAHIIGNGSDGAPSNAHTLDWNGNAWFAGDIKIGGTGSTDSNAVSIKNTLTEINNKVTNIQKLIGSDENGAYIKVGSTIVYEEQLQKLLALLDDPGTPDEPDVPTANYAMYNNENLTHNDEYLIIE